MTFYVSKAEDSYKSDTEENGDYQLIVPKRKVQMITINKKVGSKWVYIKKSSKEYRSILMWAKTRILSDSVIAEKINEHFKSGNWL